MAVEAGGISDIRAGGRDERRSPKGGRRPCLWRGFTQLMGSDHTLPPQPSPGLQDDDDGWFQIPGFGSSVGLFDKPKRAGLRPNSRAGRPPGKAMAKLLLNGEFSVAFRAPADCRGSRLVIAAPPFGKVWWAVLPEN